MKANLSDFKQQHLVSLGLRVFLQCVKGKRSQLEQRKEGLGKIKQHYHSGLWAVAHKTKLASYLQQKRKTHME